MFGSIAVIGALSAVFASTFVIFPLSGSPDYRKMVFDACKQGMKRGVNSLVALAKMKMLKQTA